MSEPTTRSFMWPFPESTVTDDYGLRPGVGKVFHDGTDFSQATGTPIPCIGDGVVTNVGIHSDAGPYAIDVDHGGGFHSQYWHCDSRNVSAGQAVKKGQIIGTVGERGYSVGAHLHLEIVGPGSPSGRYSWPWRDFFNKFNRPETPEEERPTTEVEMVILRNKDSGAIVLVNPITGRTWHMPNTAYAKMWADRGWAKRLPDVPANEFDHFIGMCGSLGAVDSGYEKKIDEIVNLVKK